MPKIDLRDLDSVDDDFLVYEKFKRNQKKENNSEQKPKIEPKKN